MHVFDKFNNVSLELNNNLTSKSNEYLAKLAGSSGEDYTKWLTNILSALSTVLISKNSTATSQYAYTTVETLGGEVTTSDQPHFESLFYAVARGLFDTPDLSAPGSVARYDKPLLPIIVDRLDTLTQAVQQLVAVQQKLSDEFLVGRPLPLVSRGDEIVTWSSPISFMDLFMRSMYAFIPTRLNVQTGDQELTPVSLATMNITTSATRKTGSTVIQSIVPRTQVPSDAFSANLQPTNPDFPSTGFVPFGPPIIPSSPLHAAMRLYSAEHTIKPIGESYPVGSFDVVSPGNVLTSSYIVQGAHGAIANHNL